MSVPGNESTSRIARSAMYCAVHSPTPEIAHNRAIASSVVPDGRNRSVSSATALATARNVFRRAAGIPSPISDTDASRSAAGNVCVNPENSAKLFGSAFPCSATSSPASLLAAATLTCCPSTARTASSNPSHPPGVSPSNRDSEEPCSTLPYPVAPWTKSRTLAIAKLAVFGHGHCYRKTAFNRPGNRASKSSRRSVFISNFPSFRVETTPDSLSTRK